MSGGTEDGRRQPVEESVNPPAFLPFRPEVTGTSAAQAGNGSLTPQRRPLARTFSINQLIDEAHTTAVEHGFNDPTTTVGDDLALIHSELSEALEEHRDGHAPAEHYYRADGKPEGIPAELADVVIRVAHFAGRYGIDLERAILEKAAFNRSRPFKHGGRRL